MASEISLDNISRLCSLFREIGDSTGCRLIWHTFVPNQLLRIPDFYLFHEVPYCQRIKGRSIRARCRCTEEHWSESIQRSLNERRPFLHTCHAGVTEIVVPIFEGEAYCGDILIGSFRSGQSPPEGAFQAEYLELPVLRPELAEHLPKLVLQLLELLPPHLPDGAEDPLCPVAPPGCDPRVHLALAVLRRHFAGKVDYGKLAAQTGLSDSRLRHLFLGAMGMSMSEYLQRLRISYARPLVELTPLPMSAVAEACGIFDQARLSFLFRKYYGVSPSRWRENSPNSRSYIKNGR